MSYIYMGTKKIETWFKHNISINKILFLVVCLTVLYNEIFVYWIQSSNWPQLPEIDSDEELVVLLVADPQIQGNKGVFGFPLDSVSRWDADRHLHRTFQLAYSYGKPNVVIFLGDLMDDGSQASHTEYIQYLNRFHSIFHSAKQSKVIYIPGDNDIGGEGRDFRTTFKEARYEKYFEDINGVVNTRLVDFLKLDVKLHSDVPPGTYEKLKEYRSNMTSTFRVILTHESMLPKFKNYIYPILREIQPQLILSGHWHKAIHYLCDSCINDNSDSGHWPVHVRHLSHIRDFIHVDVTNSEGIQELTVPTCSYRMGELDLGYGLAIINKDNTVKYTVLWLPHRYQHLQIYIIVIIILIIIYLFTKLLLSQILYLFFSLIRPISKKN